MRRITNEVAQLFLELGIFPPSLKSSPKDQEGLERRLADLANILARDLSPATGQVIVAEWLSTLRGLSEFLGAVRSLPGL